MRRRTTAVIGCGVGLVGGFALAFLGGAAGPNDGSRYQLHVWSVNGFAWGSGSKDEAAHGAYRLDTQTGEVDVISGYDGKATKVDFK